MTARGSVAKRGTAWRARYRDEDGREHQRSFARKGEASAWLRDQLAKLTVGTWVDPAAGTETVSEYGAQWLKLQAVRSSTAELQEARLRRYIAPAIGDVPLRSVRRSHVQQLIAHCQGMGLTANVTKAAVVQLRMMLDAAVADKLVPANVARDKTIAVPRSEALPVVLDADQVAAVAAHIRPRLRAMVLLGAASGLRSGELRGLSVDRFSPPVHVTGDVLPQQTTITVDRQMNQDRQFAPVKTRNSVRSITVGPAVVSALVSHVRQFGLGPGGLLFTNEVGADVSTPMLARAWTSAVAECAKAGTSLPAGASLHSLRHHHASTLLSAGISIAAVSARLGHASPTVTLATYAHMMPNDDQRMLDASEAIAARVANG